MNDNLNKIKMEQNYMNNDIDEIRKRNLILVRDNDNLVKDNEKLRIKINNNNICIKEDIEKSKNKLNFFLGSEIKNLYLCIQ